ncbi:hypothetical protein ACEWY4_003807 [Coilia grayii]|uniref:Integrase core domain-containing protein n=1 Tax=Coilia grayii TaxID=363190 RepID=A0ABD1KSW7_9TELE
MLSVSRSTVFRRMKEFGLSARRYHEIDDGELDNVVQSIKIEMPTSGYRMVKGRLRSLGIHVPWRRVAASLHRVDSVGILSRLSGLGCILRRTYSVRGPLSLWHVDTNHKLIRYNIVLFGAVDGYSRKDIEEPDIDWDIAIDHNGEKDGAIVVPQIDCPLSEEKREGVQALLEQSDPDLDPRELYLLCHEYLSPT